MCELKAVRPNGCLSKRAWLGLGLGAVCNWPVGVYISWLPNGGMKPVQVALSLQALLRCNLVKVTCCTMLWSRGMALGVKPAGLCQCIIVVIYKCLPNEVVNSVSDGTLAWVARSA